MAVRGGVRALKDRAMVPARQADAVISQANPVSTTLYPVLDARNAVIHSAYVTVTWTVQPTPLDLIVTVDDIAHIHSVANPITTQPYEPASYKYTAATGQLLVSTVDDRLVLMGPIYVGRTVKIEVRTTGGTVSILACRVKWSKW